MVRIRQAILWNQLRLFVIGYTLLTLSSATHFRGGTISWKPVGGTEVEFFFKMSWDYNRGPGCTETKIGQFVNKKMLASLNHEYWECVDGCGSSPVQLTTVGYNCMAANKWEKWELGQRSFNYTFSHAGEFNVSFTGEAWMKLEQKKGNGDWNIQTSVDLRERSDLGRPNSSPVAQSQAIYNMQYGCHHELRIPVLDPDNDDVRCRWAKGKECESVCGALHGGTLNETTCTLTFDAVSSKNYTAGGYYGIALIVEDFPPSTITLNGTTTKTPSDSLSSVPMQFLIRTPKHNTPCDSRPRFVTPTPDEGSILVVVAGDTITIEMVADNDKDLSTKIKAINIMGPVDLQQTSLKPYQNVSNTFFRNITWDTSTQNIGEHIVCSYASDANGKTGDSRCFTIKIVPVIVDYCQSNPCANGGVCQNGPTNFTCLCVNGWQGALCDYKPAPPNKTNSHINQMSQVTVGSCASLGGLGYMNNVSCQAMDYCDCSCFIYPFDSPEEENNTLRYLLAAFIGFPIGLVLSLLTLYLCTRCYVCSCCCSSHAQSYRDQHPPAARLQGCAQSSEPPVEACTKEQKPQVRRVYPPGRASVGMVSFKPPSSHSLLSKPRPTPHPEAKGGTATPMNIYRTSFSSDALPNTAPKKSLDTYTSGARDWKV